MHTCRAAKETLERQVPMEMLATLVSKDQRDRKALRVRRELLETLETKGTLV